MLYRASDGVSAYSPVAIISFGLICLLSGVGLGWFSAQSGADNHAFAVGTTSESAIDAALSRKQPVAGRTTESSTVRERFEDDRVEGQVPILALDSALKCAESSDFDKGFKCLRSLARFSLNDDRVRAAFIRALNVESDLGRKAQILELMMSVPLAPEDLAPILEEIDAVVGSQVPAVQSIGLISLAQWNRSDEVDARLRAKLYDFNTDPVVAKAAVTGLQIRGVGTQETKDVLLLIARDATPGSEIQGAAIDALRGAQLNSGEYGVYRVAMQRFDSIVGNRK